MKRSILTGLFSSYAAFILINCIQFFINPYMLGKLNTEKYGMFILVFQIVSYFHLFDFGLGSAVSRQLTICYNERKFDKINTIVFSSFVLFFLIGFSFLLFGLTSTRIIAHFLNIGNSEMSEFVSLFKGFSLIIFFQFLLKPLTSIFYSLHKQYINNVIIIFTYLIQMVCTIFFLEKSYGLEGLVHAQLIALFFNYVITFFYLNRLFPELELNFKYFNYSTIRQLFNFGWFIFLNGVAVQIIFFTDKILIGSFVSLSAVAIFTFVSKIPELVMNVVWKITDNTFPYLVSKSGKTQDISQLHQKLMTVTSFLSFNCIGLISLFLIDFLDLWLPEKVHLDYVTLILVLVTNLFLHTTLHVSALCLTSIGKVKEIGIVSIFDASLNIILSIYLVKIWGINGILFSTVIAGFITSFWVVVRLVIVNLKISFFQYFRPIINSFLTTLIFFIPLYYLKFIYLDNIDSWWKLLISGTLVLLFSSVFSYFAYLKSYFRFSDFQLK